jgi:LDH2 family malate/lactate/ureidoglycolate dehydrogenase
MIEICCGILGGANYSKKIRKWSTIGSYDEANLGQCFVALNPECFAPGFSQRLTEMHAILRSLTPVFDFEIVFSKITILIFNRLQKMRQF